MGHTYCTSVLKEGMDQGLLAVTGGSAAKGLAMGLEVAVSGPVQLPFSPPPPFFPTMCSPQVCLSPTSTVHMHLYMTSEQGMIRSYRSMSSCL